MRTRSPPTVDKALAYGDNLKKLQDVAVTGWSPRWLRKATKLLVKEESVKKEKKDRMMTELTELCCRTISLERFMLTPAYEALPELEKHDLSMQLVHMDRYALVLGRRVARAESGGQGMPEGGWK